MHPLPPFLFALAAPALAVAVVSDADINTLLARRRPLILSSVLGQQAAKSLCQGAGDPSSIPTWLSSLRSNGMWPSSQIDYTSGCAAQRANWPALCHWQRIVALAAAWLGPLPGADKLYQDASALRAALNAMDWWFQNDFTTSACLDSGGTSSCPCGTSGLWNTNWFSNIIGIPTLVAETCLLLGNSLSGSQKNNCSTIALRAYGTFGHNINGLGPITGANTLDIASIGIDIGLLHRNASILQEAYDRMHAEVVIHDAPGADGIRPDGSFGQHSGILYNGNYGKDYTNDVLKLELAAAQTSLEANKNSKSAFKSLIAGYQWMTFMNTLTGTLHWDFSVLGRFISFPVADNQATSSIQTNLSQILALSEAWDSTQLGPVSGELSDKSISANVGNLVGNQAFWANDYMVHRGSGFVTTVKGFSARSQNTECVNSQNALGFHLSDGAMYTHVTGQEYEDIAAAWDWNLIPGITVDYGATALNCDSTGFNGIETFVGSVSTGTIGAFAMKYTNPSTKQLQWQKSWFFFRGGMQHVAASGISSKSGRPVYSVLDQKRAQGAFIVDGQEFSTGQNFTQFHSLWHANVGYSFPQTQSRATLSASLNNRSGSWSKIGTSKQPQVMANMFTAWLHHSNEASIEYTAYPGVNSSEFALRLIQRPLMCLVNDGSTTAVLDTVNNDLMVTYWKASQVVVPLLVAWPTANSDQRQIAIPIFENTLQLTVSASQPCMIIVSQPQWTVAISDPSQTLNSLTLKFSAKAFGRQVPLWHGAGNKTLTIQFPRGGSAGMSVIVSLI